MERLPKDIPGRDILLEAGFVNYAVVKCHRSFESINGMDQETADKIKEYIGLKESSDKSSDYKISELKDMDLSGKDDSFFEGDERSSIDQFK